MGNGSSKGRDVKVESEKICIECDKKNQKDLPQDTNDINQVSASRGQPCEVSYEKVTACMEMNEGQISKCREVWDAFRQCHEEHKRQ